MVAAQDENRDYSAFQAGDMADMVRRDRNHPVGPSPSLAASPSPAPSLLTPRLLPLTNPRPANL